MEGPSTHVETFAVPAVRPCLAEPPPKCADRPRSQGPVVLPNPSLARPHRPHRHSYRSHPTTVAPTSGTTGRYGEGKSLSATSAMCLLESSLVKTRTTPAQQSFKRVDGVSLRRPAMCGCHRAGTPAAREHRPAKGYTVHRLPHVANCETKTYNATNSRAHPAQLAGAGGRFGL